MVQYVAFELRLATGLPDMSCGYEAGLPRLRSGFTLVSSSSALSVKPGRDVCDPSLAVCDAQHLHPQRLGPPALK